MTRIVGPDASSGYDGGTQLSCSPTSAAGPAALWYHQALAIEMSSSGSTELHQGQAVVMVRVLLFYGAHAASKGGLQ